eukprot:TRINITY_DN2397_c0_g1_i1.p1 TRINITY_DN2397_c0_g1~~TRINITY_DN2397_c0_g1_i1.p1  ORF type:complete len:103 (+),score=24.86 TRINITY_DN2397_c0_g1_i1:75-383(+)
MSSAIMQMSNQRVAANLLQLCVVLLVVGHNIAQDNNITFLPDVPLCIGEEVEMICFVVPPAGTSFSSDSALISLNWMCCAGLFSNGSVSDVLISDSPQSLAG